LSLERYDVTLLGGNELATDDRVTPGDVGVGCGVVLIQFGIDGDSDGSIARVLNDQCPTRIRRGLTLPRNEFRTPGE
jgi:hypothetical protein